MNFKNIGLKVFWVTLVALISSNAVSAQSGIITKAIVKQAQHADSTSSVVVTISSSGNAESFVVKYKKSNGMPAGAVDVYMLTSVSENKKFYNGSNTGKAFLNTDTGEIKFSLQKKYPTGLLEIEVFDKNKSVTGKIETRY